MYLNRKNIELINALKTLWGADRFSQTNSRLNGNYLEHIRIYKSPEDKQAKTNFETLWTAAAIASKIKELSN